MAVCNGKNTRAHKHCAVRSTRHTLSDCSKYTEHATPHIPLIRLDLSVFGLAGSIRMCSNCDNLFDQLGFFWFNSDLFDFRVVRHPRFHCIVFFYSDCSFKLHFVFVRHLDRHHCDTTVIDPVILQKLKVAKFTTML